MQLPFGGQRHSVQSYVIRNLVRYGVSRALHSENPVALQRLELDTALRLSPLPRGTHVHPVQCHGVSAQWVCAKGVQPEDKHGMVLYFHGGAYNIGGAATHRNIAARLSKALRKAVLVVDYRLAPEHPFPAAIDDGVKAYDWLLESGRSARNIVLAGDSAGGGLALATALRLKEAGKPMPAALSLISPWTDLTHSGMSQVANQSLDPMLNTRWLKKMSNNYLGKTVSTHPLASPLFADLQGLPPVLVQVGSDELLLDDSVRLADKIRQQGGKVNLRVWSGMWHVWHFHAGLMPESDEAITEMAFFINDHLA